MVTPDMNHQLAPSNLPEAELATVLQFPSQRERGFLYPEESVPTSPTPDLPFDLQITKWDTKKPKFEQGIGKIVDTIVELSDTSRSDISRVIMRSIEPEDQKYDVSADFMLPLGTRVNGLNTYIARKTAQAGMPTREIGTNQTHNHTMQHDAQVTLMILRAADEELGNISAPGKSIFHGYSKGDMMIPGIVGLAPLFDREIVASIGVDRCLADQLDYSHQDPRATGAYLLSELLEIPKVFAADVKNRSLPDALRFARHLLPTIGITPRYVMNTVDKWNTIKTGEAGTFSARLPQETVMAVHFMNRSRFNDREAYSAQLTGFKNIRVVEENGLHLSFVSRTAIANLIEDLVLVQEMHAGKSSATDLADALTRPLLKR